MSNFRYNKHSCQKEREHSKNIKHCVRSPHRYVTKVSNHEKCVENLSNLNLQQGTICVQPTCKIPSSDNGTESCRKGETKSHKKSTCSATNSADTKSNKAKSNPCYQLRPRKVSPTAHCKGDFVWQKAKYVKDECGSGIVPLRLDIADPRRVWCQTPLTMYQSTIGELARRMLCNEIVVNKRVNVGPPCNLCEYVMPMCKGYYRKYECRRNCEENHAIMKNGIKIYRDAIQQYWMPCLTTEEKREYDLSKDADHNVYLGKKLKRQINEKVLCW